MILADTKQAWTILDDPFVDTKVERVRKKRNVFERAASAFEKAHEASQQMITHQRSGSRRFVQSSSDLTSSGDNPFIRANSLRSSKRHLSKVSQQMDSSVTSGTTLNTISPSDF